MSNVQWGWEIAKILTTAIVTAGAVALMTYLAQRRLEWMKFKREQAAAVVEFLSCWIGVKYGKGKDDNATRWEIQRRYWTLALYFDDDVLLTITKLVANTGEVVTRDVILQLRQEVLGKRGKLHAADLSQWLPLEEAAEVAVAGNAGEGGGGE